MRRGDSLRILAYSRYNFAFQVETPSGNRGFVRANLIADSMIVAKRINVDNDYLEKGERVLLTAITPPNKKKNEYSEKTTVRRGSETFTFTSGELFPIMAFGTPLYKSDEMAIVTPRWISRHFTVDIAKKAEIDKEWYGYATTVKKSGNDIVALYNFKVNDEARDKEHKADSYLPRRHRASLRLCLLGVDGLDSLYHAFCQRHSVALDDCTNDHQPHHHQG